MVEIFIEKYVKKIALDPEMIQVNKVQLDVNFYEIQIYSSTQDIGRLIGKDGKMIGSLKTLISGVKAKDGSTYRVVVKLYEI